MWMQSQMRLISYVLKYLWKLIMLTKSKVFKIFVHVRTKIIWKDPRCLALTKSLHFILEVVDSRAFWVSYKEFKKAFWFNDDVRELYNSSFFAGKRPFFKVLV